MVKNLPDKWIRKAIYDAINNVTVNGYKIPCYDTRAPKQSSDFYVILSTQSNEVDKSVKCGYRWESSILLDITGVYDINGNTGSRVMVDDILDIVRQNTGSLTLDVASGLEIIDINQSFPNDLVSTNLNSIVYRKFIRLELLIN
jgi:hypothetical protein